MTHPTTIAFSKMHGLGNDFVVIDTINQAVDITALPIQRLANRHLGIGFDQLLLIRTSQIADYACTIFNADGSEAEQCGNGVRCVARFLQENSLTQKNKFLIETKAGVVNVLIEDFDTISVAMGTPHFSSEPVPVILEEVPLTATLSLGNPHAIALVSAIEDAPVYRAGETISTHVAFPHGTNVGFMEIVTRDHIRLRTYERGVGETLACGSNACAAVAAGIAQGLLDSRVKVELIFGHLWIEWNDETAPVIMTGPASYVFKGEINL